MGGTRHHVARDEQAADQGARRAGAGPPPGEGRVNGANRQQPKSLPGLTGPPGCPPFLAFEALIELPETLLSLLSGLGILAATIANP